MSKPIMQDMITKKPKPSLDTGNGAIPPRKKEEQLERNPNPVIRTKNVEQTFPIEVIGRGRAKSHSYKWLKILFACIAFSVLIYFVCNLFANAHLDIKVKHELVSLNRKQFDASKSSGGDTNFEITISNDQELKMMSLTESSVVSEKAKGKIILYNAYTEKSQAIIAETFVDDNTGKAYKTDSRVIIPGYKTVEGKIVPGQAEVSVTAFLDGESYNGTPSDFIITAFKNTPKAGKIYGKASTPMTGGAKGLIYRLNNKDKEQLDKYASTVLRDKLFAKMSALVPKGYILYPNASTFSYHIDENMMAKESSANVVISTTTASVLLKEQDLIRSIIKNTMPSIVMPELSEIELKDIKNLTFNFVNKNQTITKDMQSVAFTLTGDIDAVWHPNLLSLKQSLSGIHKDSINQILQKEPGIASSKIRLFPGWKSNLPINQERIYIKAE